MIAKIVLFAVIMYFTISFWGNMGKVAAKNPNLSFLTAPTLLMSAIRIGSVLIVMIYTFYVLFGKA